MLWRIYGLIILSNKVSVGLFAPIVAFLDQSSRLALELWAQGSGKTDVRTEHKEDKAGEDLGAPASNLHTAVSLFWKTLTLPRSLRLMPVVLQQRGRLGRNAGPSCSGGGTHQTRGTGESSIYARPMQPTGTGSHVP